MTAAPSGALTTATSHLRLYRATRRSGWMRSCVKKDCDKRPATPLFGPLSFEAKQRVIGRRRVKGEVVERFDFCQADFPIERDGLVPRIPPGRRGAFMQFFVRFFRRFPSVRSAFRNGRTAFSGVTV